MRVGRGPIAGRSVSLSQMGGYGKSRMRCGLTTMRLGLLWLGVGPLGAVVVQLIADLKITSLWELLLAAWIPAARAGRLPPADVLRND